MKAQNVSKLSFLLGGLCERIKENEDIFVNADGSLKSGTVEYKFSIEKKEENYKLFYKKEAFEGAFSEIIEILKNDLKLYDEFYISFRDRVSTLIVTADDRRVNMTTKNEDNTALLKNIKSEKNEEHIISPSKAAELLSALQFVTSDGKLKNSHIRKFNQAENFLKLLKPYIEKLPKDRTIYIYDLACGKSYLSFFINYYLCDVLKIKCHITGIDIREDVVEASKKIRDKLKYYNMDFVCADIIGYVPENPMDVAVSLHACDIATDYAIACAVNNRAKVVSFVPCCHKELLDTIKPSDELSFITEHPILKKRFNDVFTDAYRVKVLEENGYDMTLTEFVSPLDTPKNLIMLGRYTGNKKKNTTDEIENSFGVSPIIKKLIF